MWPQIVCTVVLVLEAGAAQAGIDTELLGPWTVHNDLVIVTATLPFKKVQRTELFHLKDLHFYKHGTLKVRLLYLREQKTVDLNFYWRSEKAKDGRRLLYLYSQNQIYLVAHYLIKDKKLWLTFSLERERSREEAPRTFDPYQEDDVLLQVLVRPPERQKKSN